jgi:N-acetylglutamate synthase-like GNAT family acetyltransferase
MDLINSQRNGAEKIIEDPRESKSIRKAEPSDFGFVRSLIDKNRKSLGFLPTEAIVNYTKWGCITVGEQNDLEAGCLIGKHVRKSNPGISGLYHAVVEMDARRHSIGRRLLADFVKEARIAGSNMIQLWCASDLEANIFWSTAGFQPIAMRTGSRVKSRLHVLWRLPLNSIANLRAFPAKKRHEFCGLARMIPETLTAAAVIKELVGDNGLHLYTHTKRIWESELQIAIANDRKKTAEARQLKLQL